jgi:hypothetical protein
MYCPAIFRLNCGLDIDKYTKNSLRKNWGGMPDPIVGKNSGVVSIGKINPQ